MVPGLASDLRGVHAPRRQQRLWRVAAIAIVLLASVPAAAQARWTDIAKAPMGSEPYLVCAPRADDAACAAIEDPTRGAARRGSIAAGAITKGPEDEVSPALSGSGVEGGYSPEDLRAAYKLPSTTGGSGQTVAVVDAFHDPTAEADLGAYRAEYGLPPCTATEACFREVNQTGGTSYPASNAVWSREISLDLDMVSAICPDCHILLVESNNEETTNLAAAEDEAVWLGATEISNSYAERGASQPASLRAAYDHPGIPITAAAGDEGYGVSSPAASPNVIAVGGTTLEPSASRRGWSETVWSKTGSGCTAEDKPSWQTDSGCAHRTMNDVAAVADPNTPVSVYDSYDTGSPWLLLGGTSVATPIVAATMALADSYTRSFDGAHALYMATANEVGGFNDVLSGSNGSCEGSYLCVAGLGYDGPSGLGSLRGAPTLPPPLAITGTASAITKMGATLEATVKPHAAELSECELEYGSSTEYGQSAPCAPTPGPLTTSVPVAASVGGLDPAATYHFRIAIRYPGGSAVGADASFTTLATPPTLSSAEASAITQSSANLTAQVDPEGEAVQTCSFEYGTSTLYGSSSACTSLPAQGRAPVAVGSTITGLEPNTTYHLRITAENAAGVSYGVDQTFDTLPTPSPPPEPEPEGAHEPPPTGAGTAPAGGAG